MTTERLLSGESASAFLGPFWTSNLLEGALGTFFSFIGLNGLGGFDESLGLRRIIGPWLEFSRHRPIISESGSIVERKPQLVRIVRLLPVPLAVSRGSPAH